MKELKVLISKWDSNTIRVTSKRTNEVKLFSTNIPYSTYDLECIFDFRDITSDEINEQFGQICLNSGIVVLVVHVRICNFTQYVFLPLSNTYDLLVPEDEIKHYIGKGGSGIEYLRKRILRVFDIAERQSEGTFKPLRDFKIRVFNEQGVRK